MKIQTTRVREGWMPVPDADEIRGFLWHLADEVGMDHDEFVAEATKLGLRLEARRLGLAQRVNPAEDDDAG